MQRHVSVFIGLVMAFGVGSVSARGPEDYELLLERKSEGVKFDDGPWVEVEAAIPPLPLEKDLVEIDMGPMTNNRYYVDESSVTVAGDNVIRYAMVVVSASGARNVSFEGLRCETAERRLYALGRNDGSWSKTRTGGWKKVEGGANRYQAVLYRDYFCSTGGPVMDTATAKRVLRYGNPAAPVRAATGGQ